MTYFIIIVLCVIGLIIHASIIEKRDAKITEFDYAIFCFLFITPLMCVIDAIFG
jgi:hypothetical protein